MEPKKTEIIEKAAHIIMNYGIGAITIHNLSAELNLEENQLYNQLVKDDDILLMLLSEFENDINEFVNELSNKGVSPETELIFLFKGLYFMFQQKPYNLAIIFDKSLKKRDDSIKKCFLRISNTAENYLTTIIDAGRNENLFKNKQPTKVLVSKILSSFMLLMKDEQLVNEMILEIKTLR